jgi:hypothetical protein
MQIQVTFSINTLTKWRIITMKTRYFLLIALSFCLTGLIVAGCGSSDNGSPTGPGTVLLERDVTVAGGGGSFQVTFSASNGQSIRITLTASSNLEPYGYLTYPNGGGEYYPDLSTAQNGVNSIDLALTQTGTYELSVMDGTNRGGTVHVKVEII